MSESDTPTRSQPERRRRAHTRSRNGCFTCKQRHARCDEKRPVCTNCLSKGGACGYPDAVKLPLGSALSSASSDPFDSLPVPMPYKSHLLWYHFTHYRMFTRTPVPKNPVNNFCVGFAMSDPGLFHGCILLAAMNWTCHVKVSSTRGPDMRQTYLHHKVRAIELVKERLAQPEGAEHIADVISFLALVESGVGEIDAAEAHLNAVANLLDMTHTETWELEHHGLMQRAILLAGSLVSAARGIKGDQIEEPSPQQTTPSAHYTHRPSSSFSAAPFDSTRLSPFYHAIPPDIELCNSDMECEVTINALRRLSLMPIHDNVNPLTEPVPPLTSDDHLKVSEDAASSKATSIGSIYSPTLVSTVNPSKTDGRSGQSPDIASRLQNVSLTTVTKDAFATLIRDTDSYIGSMMFRPDPPGYKSLDPAVIPDSTRSWASAAYLYLHLVLWPMHEVGGAAGEGGSPVEHISDNLLKWLLDQVRSDANRTQVAMGLGANCGELWFWKVMVAAFAAMRQEWGNAEDEATSDWQDWATERIQSWSRRSRTRDWAGAKKALRKITCVDGSDFEDFAESLWEKAFNDE